MKEPNKTHVPGIQLSDISSYPRFMGAMKIAGHPSFSLISLRLMLRNPQGYADAE